MAFAYPHPVTLARTRAEKARDDGRPSRSLWGSVGGLVTLDRHGRDHFVRMARRRWDRWDR